MILRGLLCFDNKTETQGFTLIELLLAIFIFGVVVSAVYGSYSATFYVVSSTEKKMAVATRARTVLERISEDLASLVQGENGFFSGEQHDNSGMRGDSLSFISATHIALTKGDNLAGYATISYSAEEDEETGLLKLYRSDTRLVPGEKEEEGIEEEDKGYLLCDGLKEFKISYFDSEKVENEEWQSGDDESGGEKQTFPVLVTIVLQFAESAESEQVSFFTTSVALPQSDG